MASIKKVLNTSVVLIENEGKEMVAFGKGIGYGAKIGDVIDQSQVDQIFLSAENVQIHQFLELISTIPEVYLELTQSIVEYAKEQLESTLHQTIYFTLMDHLHFASERARKGINITNRVYWEIKNYYPNEFRVGEYARKLVNEKLTIELPEEESANIAFHIINAQSSQHQTADSMKAAKIVGGIVNLVRYNLNTSIPTNSIHYNRFITHVKFFAERFLSNTLMEETDDLLFNQISTLYPEAMTIAYKIKKYVKQVYQMNMPHDELTYLAVHINRLRKYSELEN